MKQATLQSETNIQSFLDKVEKVTKEKKLDLSSDEDLSIAIMNLISIEEHLFFTSQKTGKKSYLELLDQIRNIRKDLLKHIIKDYEGEIWCISKHLLASSMRLMEVGTKELGQGNKERAWDLFSKSYQLYSLFWGINLKLVGLDSVKRKENHEVAFLDEKGSKAGSSSLFDKLGEVVQKAIDCCKE